jgi:cysteine desulfurase
MKAIYLDYAATTPVEPEVLQAMTPFFRETFGNPSSIHSFGQQARSAVENAREKVASFLGAKPSEIVFTSGGTESNNAAIKGVAYANRKKGNHIVTSAIEHHAVTEPCHFLEQDGFDVTFLPVDPYGSVDPRDLERAITGRTVLVSIMHANNEIGTLQPIADIGRITRERGIFFHTDAVQTFGHMPFTVDELNVDLLSLSAHKLYGPKGVGALYVRQGTRMEPHMHGGGQEGKRRASTHNVPGIVGLAKAVELAEKGMPERVTGIRRLRDRLIRGVCDQIDGVHLNGHPEKRLANNANISIEHCEGEALLLSLDLMGIACATGSACSSTSVESSHVLRALGLSAEQTRGSLRFSLGRYTEEKEIDRVLEVLPKIVKRLRAMSPAYRSGAPPAGAGE